MAIKWTPLGLLIYLAMSAWAVGFIAFAAAAVSPHDGKARARLGRVGEWLFALGSAILVGGFVYRWVEVAHVPLQSKFEVFLCLGMLMWPLWVFCRRMLGARGPAANVLIGLAILFPAGFIFPAEPQVLPPALQSWLFLPHVSAYMLAYVALAMAGAQAGLTIIDQARGRADAARDGELATWRIIRLGLPLLTLGLVLGALWGKLAWGDYWNWDPKEQWSLATFLVYVAYVHARCLLAGRRVWIASSLALVGVLFVVITLLVVTMGKLFPGLHAYAG